MTTTLRPTGPLQLSADGVRTRGYRICVNSRPVGAVDLGTDPSFGPSVGVVSGLRVDGEDRRRGRGTVAVLAAEEVLRGWGCRQVLASVPADAAAAAGLFGALGYGERSRSMAKDLPARVPALPEGVEDRPMTAAEFAAWSASSREAFALSWAERGMSAQEADAKAASSHRQSLPDGLATPGTHFRVLWRDGVATGHVWVAERHPAESAAGAFVYDVGVAREHRGQGLGRALMTVAERLAADWHARWIGLHVFSDNVPALHLYESLGYRVTGRHLAKPLL